MTAYLLNKCKMYFIDQPYHINSCLCTFYRDSVTRRIFFYVPQIKSLPFVSELMVFKITVFKEASRNFKNFSISQ